MIPHLKLNINFADAVRSGEKCFEVRENDRGFQKGDLVVFQIMDGNIPVIYDVNEMVFKITYVLNGWGIKENYCVFGIKNIDKTKGETE